MESGEYSSCCPSSQSPCKVVVIAHNKSMSIATMQLSTSDPLQPLSQRVPFIVDGFVSSWPAFSCWTDGYLVAAVGKNVVEVESYPTPLFSPEAGDAGFPKRMMPMRDFLRYERAANSTEWLYAAQISILDRLEPLVHDISMPPWIRDQPYRIAFWMGMNGTGTRLHYDPFDNVMAVVRGAKIFSMLPPQHFGSIYPYKAYSRWGHFSKVDVEAPDKGRFPKFPPPGMITCRVEAGQALCIPHGWWHQVINDPMSVAVNFFYTTRFPRNCSVPMLRFQVGKIWRWVHRNRKQPAAQTGHLPKDG